MPSPYQEFVRRAKERYQKQQKQKLSLSGYQFTTHARYKMKQYSLSEQKVKGVIRRPTRTEEGVVPKTVAVMQPVSPKKVGDKEVWKQEVWVMYQKKSGGQSPLSSPTLKIISAWRYPGISPKRSPIPEEIWQELENQGILEE